MPADPKTLDFRFKTECPQCGERSGWDGEVQKKDGKISLGMRCTHCPNTFFYIEGASQAALASQIPSFIPGNLA